MGIQYNAFALVALAATGNNFGKYIYLPLD